MPTDRYTKTLLTVIAAALVAIAAQNAMSASHAQVSITRVALCDPVNINTCAAVFDVADSQALFTVSRGREP